MKKVVMVMLLLILTLVVAIPAGATPPEEIDIVSESRFKFWDFYNPDVSWDSTGVVESSGWSDGTLEHFGAGWPHGIGFKTAHVVTMLADEHGTMTLRIDTNNFEWYSDITECLEFLPDDGLTKSYDEPYTECFHGHGVWRILSGTGAYADLHGQGKVTLTGFVDWNAFIMDTVEVFHGWAHFDPN